MKIGCQFCNYQISIRPDVHIAHVAMQMASHIMTYHCRTWGEEE